MWSVNFALEAMVEKLEVIGVVATLIKIRGKVLLMSLFKELWVPCYVFGVINKLTIGECDY